MTVSPGCNCGLGSPDWYVSAGLQQKSVPPLNQLVVWVHKQQSSSLLSEELLAVLTVRCLRPSGYGLFRCAQSAKFSGLQVSCCSLCNTSSLVGVQSSDSWMKAVDRSKTRSRYCFQPLSLTLGVCCVMDHGRNERQLCTIKNPAFDATGYRGMVRFNGPVKPSAESHNITCPRADAHHAL